VDNSVPMHNVNCQKNPDQLKLMGLHFLNIPGDIRIQSAFLSYMPGL